MNGQEFHLFRKGPNLADLSLEQVLSEFLRVMLARRAYSKNCSPGRQRQLWPVAATALCRRARGNAPSASTQRGSYSSTR